MKQIASTDTLFATVRGRNSIIANLRLSGMNSMADVVASVRDAVGEGCGLLTLTLRNGSQGWTDRRSILFA